MSITDFVKDPLSYTRAHFVQFFGAVGDAVHGGTGPDACGLRVAVTYDNWSGDWKAKVFEPNNLFTEFRFVESQSPNGLRWDLRVGRSELHSVTCFPNNKDQGIRFLPWEANVVTALEIDGAATKFFTGPLSGCSVYLGQAQGGNWWAFHANRNNLGALGTTADKAAMTLETIHCMGNAITIRCHALKGTDYNDAGFVFGVRGSGNAWKFYIADLELTNGHPAYRMTVNELPHD